MNKRKLYIFLLLIASFFFTKQNVLAADINLTIRDSDSIVFSGIVPFPSNITSLNDGNGAPHEVNPNSVLSILASADESSAYFSISNLQYFDSFNSLYVKCITDTNGEKLERVAVGDVFEAKLTEDPVPLAALNRQRLVEVRREVHGLVAVGVVADPRVHVGADERMSTAAQLDVLLTRLHLQVDRHENPSSPLLYKHRDKN
jgi:hypothetical protein